MAVTNLHLARHIDGRKVKISDLKVGLMVEFPSGLGGTVECGCVLLDKNKAVFESIKKEHPRTFVCKFNVKDFDKEDFIALSDALKAYAKFDVVPSEEQRRVVTRGQELGYAYRNSYTQANWTDEGVKSYNMFVNEKPA